MQKYDIRLDLFQMQLIKKKCPGFILESREVEFDFSPSSNLKYTTIVLTDKNGGNCGDLPCFSYCQEKSIPIQLDIEVIISNIHNSKVFKPLKGSGLCPEILPNQ